MGLLGNALFTNLSPAKKAYLKAAFNWKYGHELRKNALCC